MKNLASEKEAIDQSERKVLEILNNKDLLNPDRFRQESLSYRKKQQEIENEIMISVEKQIEDISSVGEFVNKSNDNITKTMTVLQQLQRQRQSEQPFILQLSQFEKLSLFKKNVGSLIEEIKFYFDIKKQTDKLQALFEEDTQNYEFIHYKLMTQTELRDNLIEKMKQRGDNPERLNEEFKILTSFETTFYNAIFAGFENAPIIARKDPNQLIQLVKIIQSGDKFLAEKNKPQTFQTRAFEAINQSINKRFESKLDGATDAILILDRANFTVSDLIGVQDFVVKCFPEEMEIFKLYEKGYRENIERRVLPSLSDEEKIRASYGTPIKLIQWVNEYEKMLTKAGMETTDYQGLKAIAIQYMPLFQDHLRDFFRSFIEKCIESDRQKYLSVESIAKIVTDRAELISDFPVDSFGFINTQIDILGPQLEPNQFIEFLRLVSSNFNDCVIIPEKQQLQQELQELPLDGDSFYTMCRILIFLNGFHKCDKNCADTRKQALSYFEGKEESYLDRIDNIIQNDLRKKFKDGIADLQQLLLVVIYREIHALVLPELFTEKWMKEEINVASIVKTIEGHLKSMKQGMKSSKIHFGSLCKLTMDHCMNIYWEQLVLQIKKAYPHACKAYIPENLLYAYKTEAGKSEKVALVQQFSSYDKVSTRVMNDGEVISAFMTTSTILQLSSTQISAVQGQFQVFKSILTTSKYDLNTQLSTVQKAFSANFAPFFLEALLTIRDGIETKDKETLVSSLKRMIQTAQENANSSNSNQTGIGK